MSQCRVCHQDIVWAKSMTREGAWIPLDPSTDSATGCVRKRFVEETPGRPTVYGEVLKGESLHAAIANGEALWTLHRESCNAHRPHNPMPAHIRESLPRKRRTFRS